MAATRWSGSWRAAAVAAMAAGCGLAGRTASADRVEMEDGRVFEGRFATLPGVGMPPEGASARQEAGGTSVVMCDDGLSRTFVPRRLVRSAEPAGFDLGQEAFTIDQRIPDNGRRVASLGGILETTPFDRFGRRILVIATDSGRLEIVQGITSVTPRWTRIQAVVTERPVLLDMRVATSSIPIDQLVPVLENGLDRTVADDRLRLIRFLVQSERFEEARSKLDEALRDFPELQDLAALGKMLARKTAERLLGELEARLTAGQERAVLAMLEAFPVADADVETLEIVRERRDDLRGLAAKADAVRAAMERSVAGLEEGPDRDQASGIVDEISAGVSAASLGRLAPFERLGADGSLSADRAVALAISGWLEGAAAARDNLKLAVSSARVRTLVREYLRSATQPDREAILRRLGEEEAFDPGTVSRLASSMQPPLAPPEPVAAGLHELTFPGGEGLGDVTCLVQLPPEYDPHRRYPAVVTLHAAFTTPAIQVDWWAGTQGPDGLRRGQAARHGCIVIAPAWARKHQASYEYSARERAAVVGAVRESMKRFAIDSDRIFLSGHSMGGDAAWDMALAHPDLWAGLIAIVPTADRYVSHYWPNARSLPIYVVGGELDGGRLAKNGMDLDRCLQKGFDLTYVEYQGRGHEHFSDEILRIFDWMRRKVRNPFPRSFEAVSMRPWDRFFWWVEFEDAPERTIVLPSLWPPPPNARPLSIEARATESKTTGGCTVTVGCGAKRVLVWLSPEFVDFDEAATITVDGRRLFRGRPEPDVRTLLEDLRTRGDRQHPFWTVLDSSRGR